MDSLQLISNLMVRITVFGPKFWRCILLTRKRKVILSKENLFQMKMIPHMMNGKRMKP